MSVFSRLRGATGAVLLLVASTVSAAPITFNFTWSGASLGNNARATGYIVFESTLLPNPGNQFFNLPSSAVLDLSITVTGAAAGNGTFPLAAFSGVTWETNGATLDLTRQLVGQPTPQLPWGTPTDAALPTAGDGGDFNLFGGQPTAVSDSAAYYAAPRGVGSPAPVGVNYFRLATNGGTGDNMLLTGFGPAGAGSSFASNVPATSPFGIAVLAAVLALAGMFAARRARAR
jgi:hypothetical protein